IRQPADHRLQARQRHLLQDAIRLARDPEDQQSLVLHQLGELLLELRLLPVRLVRLLLYGDNPRLRWWRGQGLLARRRWGRGPVLVRWSRPRLSRAVPLRLVMGGPEQDACEQREWPGDRHRNGVIEFAELVRHLLVGDPTAFLDAIGQGLR